MTFLGVDDNIFVDFRQKYKIKMNPVHLNPNISFFFISLWLSDVSAYSRPIRAENNQKWNIICVEFSAFHIHKFVMLN